ncbi:hypothetical protein GCM10025867_28030 [Frondihabitans sucicola]|uniref:Uncharacterized protein n=1 Tax=Frondihabitans sucicola TaxID=1268041 RepID=A0ABM8GQ28_9MICO|nr:hypothetical protein [Frondihabitans sucicola]BDZ50562.1 hypothetical protein GCM10025867_28030 [Frondihabitans sucicola]
MAQVDGADAERPPIGDAQKMGEPVEVVGGRVGWARALEDEDVARDAEFAVEGAEELGEPLAVGLAVPQGRSPMGIMAGIWMSSASNRSSQSCRTMARGSRPTMRRSRSARAVSRVCGS